MSTDRARPGASARQPSSGGLASVPGRGRPPANGVGGRLISARRLGPPGEAPPIVADLSSLPPTATPPGLVALGGLGLESTLGPKRNRLPNGEVLGHWLIPQRSRGLLLFAVSTAHSTPDSSPRDNPGGVCPTTAPPGCGVTTSHHDWAPRQRRLARPRTCYRQQTSRSLASKTTVDTVDTMGEGTEQWLASSRCTGTSPASSGGV